MGLFCFNPIDALAEIWRVVPEKSKIGFIATYDGIPFEAVFQIYQATIKFDPHQLDQASFKVEIQMGSVDSQSPDRDEGMKTEEWFSTTTYPMAQFTSISFESVDTDNYQVRGELSIKDITRIAELAFSWKTQGDNKILDLSSILRRSDFDIGIGEWADDEIIGFDVEVKAYLYLQREQRF